MTELIHRNLEQMRAQAIKEAQDRRKQESNFQAKVDNLSGHNVGGLYDIRSILKSQQFKEQSNHYSVQQASDELEDLLTANRIYTLKNVTSDFIKKVSGRDGDSFTIRETGKFISELINKMKEKYEIKN